MYLTEDELILILVQALVKARKLRSGLSEKERPRIHVAIQGVKRREEPVVVYSDESADETAKKVSQLKASVVVKHSSNDLAMSSHSVGHMMATKKGMTPTVSHGGAVPLYKKGVLVGSVGISGDAPEVDEAIAHAAAENFAAPEHIRSNVVLDIPFHSSQSSTKSVTPSLVGMGSCSVLSSMPVGTLSPGRTSRLERSEALGRSSRTERLSRRNESPSTGSLPPLPSSVSVSTLPPLPVMSAPPTPSSLPPLSPNYLPTLSAPASPLPPLKASPLAASSFVSASASPLPPLRAGSSLSSLAPSAFVTSGASGTTVLKLPVLPPSPQPFRTTSSLPPLSTLTPLK